MPKRDGSGKGVGANRGRGCSNPTGKNRRSTRGVGRRKKIAK